MSFVILYIATLAAFLIIDFVGLGMVVKPVFDRSIGHLLREDFLLLPALAFYTFFAFVLVWFVSAPAMAADHSLWWVLGNGALIGAAAFGTYEFTSFAIMKDWTWRMVWLDLAWGTALTGVSAVVGVWVARIVI